MSRRVLIITSLIRPPIPDRNHDWQAVLDSYELGDPIGHGPTEADAVYDLYMQIEERDQELLWQETGNRVEIERLRAEIERLRAALEDVATGICSASGAASIAQDALAGKARDEWS